MRFRWRRHQTYLEGIQEGQQRERDRIADAIENARRGVPVNEATRSRYHYGLVSGYTEAARIARAGGVG